MLKAISLWQPYAQFMAINLKQNETRGWATDFRGDLAICAAKRVPQPLEFGQDVEDLVFFQADEWTADGYKTTTNKHSGKDRYAPSMFPLGAVVCVVEVYDCISTEDAVMRRGISNQEIVAGDYTQGRFAWLTRNCRRLQQPIPVSGKQGFFFLPSEVEYQVRSQLSP